MSTEISTHTPPARGLALASMDDAYRFAKMVAATEFAPKDFRGKPEACLLAIQAGAEVGLSPMQSLQSIAVINGKPSVYGDTALAVCKCSPVCEWVRERIEGDGDTMVAICEAKRNGQGSLANRDRGRSTRVGCFRCVLAASHCVTRSPTCSTAS